MLKKRYFLLLFLFLPMLAAACGHSPCSGPDSKTEPSATGIINPTASITESAESTTAGEKNDSRIFIQIDDMLFTAVLYDNPAAHAFAARLPLALDMNELNSNEKYFYLPDALPQDSTYSGAIQEGDLMLYGNRCIVLFYESFPTTYHYTPLGHIENADGLAAALGSGAVRVTFRLTEHS